MQGEGRQEISEECRRELTRHASPPDENPPRGDGSPDHATPEDPRPEEKEALIERFLSGDGRERRRILTRIRSHLTRDDVIRIAPTLRDPSPRNAARMTALLARHGLDELFESLLEGLKRGKMEILRNHYRKIAEG